MAQVADHQRVGVLDEVSSVTLRAPFSTLLDPKVTRLYQRPKSLRPPQERSKAPHVARSLAGPPSEPALVGAGLSKSPLVEVRGFEPLTSSVRDVLSNHADVIRGCDASEGS